MTKSAFSRESGLDDYHILQHLFNEAQLQSVSASFGDKHWSLYATYTAPENTVLTEYIHHMTRDRIKCQSFDYADAEYKTHIYTFTQGVDE